VPKKNNNQKTTERGGQMGPNHFNLPFGEGGCTRGEGGGNEKGRPNRQDAADWFRGFTEKKKKDRRGGRLCRGEPQEKTMAFVFKPRKGGGRGLVTPSECVREGREKRTAGDPLAEKETGAAVAHRRRGGGRFIRERTVTPALVLSLQGTI